MWSGAHRFWLPNLSSAFQRSCRILQDSSVSNNRQEIAMKRRDGAAALA